MSLVDGQGTVFEFDGVVVGRITRYNTVDGVTPDVKIAPLGGSENEYLPGVPEFGSLTLNLYRDFADPGQQKMEDARAISKKVLCKWTLSNGVSMAFPAYVKKLPIVGSDNGLSTADAVIKIAGKITLA